RGQAAVAGVADRGVGEGGGVVGEHRPVEPAVADAAADADVAQVAGEDGGLLVRAVQHRVAERGQAAGRRAVHRVHPHLQGVEVLAFLAFRDVGGAVAALLGRFVRGRGGRRGGAGFGGSALGGVEADGDPAVLLPVLLGVVLGDRLLRAVALGGVLDAV